MMNVFRIGVRAVRFLIASAIIIAIGYFGVLIEIQIVKELSLKVPPREEKVRLWLPEDFSIANELKDGTTLNIKSITVTNILVPFEAYQLLAEGGHSTLVVQSDRSLFYLLSTRGKYFYAKVPIEPKKSSGPTMKVDSLDLLPDRSVTLKLSRDSSDRLHDFIVENFVLILLGFLLAILAIKIGPSRPFSKDAWNECLSGTAS